MSDPQRALLATVSEFEAHAAQAAQFLKLMANEHRLLVLCHLLKFGEMSVNALAEEVGLSQSALSQHLARLREDGLVTFRRDSQTLYYRLLDARAAHVLGVLHEIFCPDLGPQATT
ncbi:MAG TPA: metalloregulator ArsR/SmtB family transcription factor [Caulobacteraceae bacterium]|nr:metalloregulator ArsR/SmtB family transcription factor [Caulobacteraceae bacterium]